MKKSGLILMLLMTTFIHTASAQEMQVKTFEFGTDVNNRELIGKDTVFSNQIETIFCYTQITGASGNEKVVHKWYYEDEPKARITLSVKSNNWRTWSSKNILNSWTGSWRVEVEDAEGNVLANKSFKISSEG